MKNNKLVDVDQYLKNIVRMIRREQRNYAVDTLIELDKRITNDTSLEGVRFLIEELMNEVMESM